MLVAVSFLARRVLVATVEDWKKLSRLVRYLRATQELGVCLSGDLLGKPRKKCKIGTVTFTNKMGLVLKS